MNLNIINKSIGLFGSGINWIIKKIPLIIILVGLYYLGKFGWKSYKKYIFGTEYDYLSKFFVRMNEKKLSKIK